MPIASPSDVSAVIVAGGDPIDPVVLERLPDRRYVVAADSGLDEVARLGLSPDVVIGDMDSVSASALRAAQADGVTLHRHPRDKDATDLELSLRHAAERGHRHVVVFGGYGGRTSHLLGNALVLAADTFATMRIEWHVGATTLTVAHPGTGATASGEPGDLVSLLAAGGDASGIVTTGLRWPLRAETLRSGSTRGISNELLSNTASVSLERGSLLVLHERKHP